LIGLIRELADYEQAPSEAVATASQLHAALFGPQPAVFSELFAPAIRYSGASLSLTLGTIFGGALAPFIATTLYGIAGNSSLVTAYVTTLSLISWLCSLGLRETYRSDFAAGPKGPALRV